MSLYLLIVPLAGVLILNLPLSFLRKCVIPFGVAFALVQAVMAIFWANELALPSVLPLVVDSLTRVMLLAIALVVISALLVGRATIENGIKRSNFANLVILALVGMNGVVLCADLFSIYVFIEIAAASSFILIASEKNRAGLEGAFKYFVLSATASVAILIGVALLLFVSGSTKFTEVALVVSASAGQPFVLIALALFVGGLFIKSGVVPFHGWVPDAYSSAPSAVSVLLAGIVTKVTGVYVLLRLVIDVFGFSSALSDVMMLVGALTLSCAALAALVQTNFKRMLAYSSISQVGYIILSFGVATPLGIAGAVFHLFNHAIFKSLLFVNAAAVEKEIGTSNMNEMGGLAQRMPVTGFSSVVGLLSTAGVPPLAGFWSKLIIILALWQAGCYAYASFAIMFSLVTLAYFLIMQRKVFFGLLRPNCEKASEVLELVVPTIMLAAITIAVGLLIPFIKGTFLLPINVF
ncbi:complex I subunit 5 family protein [Verrucomicrobiota bacterium]